MTNLFAEEETVKSVKLTFPPVPRSLKPNENIHWRIKSEPTKQYRALCKEETEKQLARVDLVGAKFKLSYRFCIGGSRGDCPHTRRARTDGKPLKPCRRCPYAPRDASNALASFKAGQDGLCDALGIEDSRKFVTVGSIDIDPKQGPWVEVLVEVIS